MRLFALWKVFVVPRLVGSAMWIGIGILWATHYRKFNWYNLFTVPRPGSQPARMQAADSQATWQALFCGTRRIWHKFLADDISVWPPLSKITNLAKRL